MRASERFIEEVVAAMEADLGGPLGTGTVVVPTDDRAGSNVAVAYPVAGRLALWCDPAVAGHLAPVAGPSVMSLDEFAVRAGELGGEAVGRGCNLTCDGKPSPVASIEGATLRVLSRDVETDVELMKTLADELSEEDLEECELDIDDLDPRLLVFVDDGSGKVVAFASGLPADGSPSFDDVGVAVHPDHRRRSLGAAVVGAFVEEFCTDGTRLALYRHDVENVGSGRLARSVGFTPVHTIGAFRWPIAG